MRCSEVLLLPLAALLMLLTLLPLPHSIDAYNIDLPSYVRYRNSANSMFGFSISLHKGRDPYNGNSLVVGAPKFDTSNYQEQVTEAGAVFRCTMDGDNQCRLVPFDSKGNNRNSDHQVIDRKSYQWLGATVATGRDSDIIVACAPRYVFHTMTPARALRYEPVGTCFASHNFQDIHEVSPCRTNNWGYHRQGSCQAGFSAAINKNGSRLFIGAPGSWYWQGQTYSIPPDAVFPYKPPFYQPFGTGGQTYSYSNIDVTRPEHQVFYTAESTSANDDSYLGYSMVSGDFDGDGQDDVAIGMPRGANLSGKIVVNRWNMANIFNVTGRQIGEYFGYSLATSDVDGDGLDDLIIGAPMYTEPGNVEGKYDVGRVYILRQGGAMANPWTREHIRDGFNTKGRFGLALCTLGDINGDGFGDFAVGAPYDGPEGRGVVYIYHGSTAGPLAKPSQTIHAEELVEGAPYPRTFGFALSGGVDMDGNSYPDLAVGAYASDQVFIFKSRPVAAVNAETKFESASKLISLDDRSCQLQRDHTLVPCVPLQTCWSYTGRNLPSQMGFDVSWLLDAKKTRNPRLFFLKDEGKNIRNMTIQLNMGQQWCHEEMVYLKDSIQDKLTPLEVETRYNLQSNRASNSRVRRQVLEPVIDQNREIILRDAINIQKNCGPDNVCEPDLSVKVNAMNKYLFGSPEPLTLEVMIKNNYEDAFEAAFYMMTPPDLQFTKLQQLGEKIDMPITCSAPDGSNNFTIKCDIGNPLKGGNMTHFAISFVPAEKHAKASSYEFYWVANSTNVDRKGSEFDNVGSKSIGIWVETDLTIKGTSLPNYQVYKAADYKSTENATTEDELGPHMVHIYELRNNQSSFIERAVVDIYYPYQTQAGDYLMYILDQPETGGNIRCDKIEVNELNLQLNEKLHRKSFLREQGAISNSAVQREGVDASGIAGAGGEAASDGAGGASTGGVHLEISRGYESSSNVGVPVGNETQLSLTPRQKELLEREDAQDAAGDASYVHLDRANQAGSGPQEATINQSSHASFMQSSAYGGGVPSEHSTHGYIQMAPKVVTSSSSSYQMRPPQQQQQQQRQQQLYLAGAGAGGAGIGGGYNGGYGADKSIYGGQGGNFHTGTIDLETLHRGNVDNELYNGAGGGSGGSGGATVHYSQPVVQHHTVYSSGSKPYYGRENEDFYDEDNQQQKAMGLGQHGQGQGQGQHQWSSSSSSSSQRRYRRNLPTDAELRASNESSPCMGVKCRVLRCYVENLGYEDADAAFVAIRARMVAKTMEKLASNVALNVSTQAVATVTQLPFIGTPKDEIKTSYEIFYQAQPEPQQMPDVVPLWVVVLAACAGALILLLLILLLWKCGFFKRNRPADHSQERQPLRNGYHGDEHL